MCFAVVTGFVYNEEQVGNVGKIVSWVGELFKISVAY